MSPSPFSDLIRVSTGAELAVLDAHRRLAALPTIRRGIAIARELSGPTLTGCVCRYCGATEPALFASSELGRCRPCGNAKDRERRAKRAAERAQAEAKRVTQKGVFDV